MESDGPFSKYGNGRKAARPYESGEFCKAIKCYAWPDRRDGNLVFCKKCKAHFFHDWIQKNGGKILMPEKKEATHHEL